MHGWVGQQRHATTQVYRSDIDGLRAIAVLSVLYYHYGSPLPLEWRLPGGFTGVDVFFVISGFLITRILRSEIIAGAFSVIGFYDRRVRRILPALIVMLAATLFAGRFLLMPGDYVALARNAATAAFGVSNFDLLGRVGYFDRAADMLPLLHTWSLAVEEQFYVVWPLALLFLVRGRRARDTAALVAGIVLLGFAASLLWLDANPKAAFFMAAPRAWELALGALLVFLPSVPRSLGNLFTLSGIATIAIGFATIRAEAFPGLFALIPCLGAALVIWPRTADCLSARWLGLLSPVGLISYSLYLWHWPVLVLFRVYTNGDLLRMREAIALAVVSIALATLSYRYIEQPFRRRRSSPAASVLAGLAASVAIFCSAMYVDSTDGAPARLEPKGVAMASRQVMWSWPCREYVSIDGHAFCGFGASWKTSRKAVLWGDSHAEHLVPMLDYIAKEKGISFILEHTCPSALGGDLNRRWDGRPEYVVECKTEHQRLVRILQEESDIDTVVIAAAWFTLATYNDLYTSNNDQPTIDQKRDLLAANLRVTVQSIDAPGRNIIVVGNMTGPGTNLSDCMAASIAGLFHRTCPAPRIDAANLRRMYKPTDDAIEAATRFPSVYFLRPTERMCDERDCMLYSNNEYIWMDYSHIRRNLTWGANMLIGHRLGFDRLLTEPRKQQ